jgi:hypothetical protein
MNRVKAIAVSFAILSLVSSNLASCSSAGNEIYGTYELVKKDLEYYDNWDRIPFADVYKAITFDKDSIFVFNIVQCSFDAEDFSASCMGNTKDYSKMDLNAAKKELDTLTMVYEKTPRCRVTAYEPFENKNNSTKGSYPTGYIASCETEYVDILQGIKESVIIQFLILKHVKDEGRVLIVPNERYAVNMLGISSPIEVKSKLSHTGKSAKKSVSELVENYKKLHKEIVKKLIDRVPIIKAEKENEQKRKEAEVAENQRKFEQKFKECEQKVDKAYKEAKKVYEKEQDAERKRLGDRYLYNYLNEGEYSYDHFSFGGNARLNECMGTNGYDYEWYPPE